MYLFKNAFKNIRIFKSKHIMMLVIFFIIASLCCISLSLWRASVKAQRETISTMTVSAMMSSFTDDIFQDYTKLPVGLVDVGTIISRTIFEPEDMMPDFYDEFEMSPYLKALSVTLYARLRGSDNFRSYAIYGTSDYSDVLNCRPAKAFEDQMVVNLMNRKQEETIEDFYYGFLEIVEGRELDDINPNYECIIDNFLAVHRNLSVGDEIDFTIGEAVFKFEIVGIYSSHTIERIKDSKAFHEHIGIRRMFIPHIYINMSGYEISKNYSTVVNDDLEFLIKAYSSDEDLTDFIEGSKSIVQGQMFDMKSTSYECVISEELAMYNNVTVGDTIFLTHPISGSGSIVTNQLYPIKIVGLYYSNEKESLQFNNSLEQSIKRYIDILESDILKKSKEASYAISSTEHSQSYTEAPETDPGIMVNTNISLNTIYMSCATLVDMIEASKQTSTDHFIKGYEYATITFKNNEDMNNFYSFLNKEHWNLSGYFSPLDRQDYFDKLVLVQRTAKIALISFLLTMLIGASFLILFNIFNLRERRYEIGVLVAIGMSKKKIAYQFLTEIITVIVFAVILGSITGSIFAQPINKYLVQEDIRTQQIKYESLTQNFGRETDIMLDASKLNNAEDLNYASNIAMKVDLTIICILIITSIILMILSMGATLIYIFQFKPVKILSESD